jgi:hypothetical protein
LRFAAVPNWLPGSAKSAVSKAAAVIDDWSSVISTNTLNASGRAHSRQPVGARLYSSATVKRLVMAWSELVLVTSKL